MNDLYHKKRKEKVISNFLFNSLLFTYGFTNYYGYFKRDMTFDPTMESVI